MRSALAERGALSGRWSIHRVTQSCRRSEDRLCSHRSCISWFGACSRLCCCASGSSKELEIVVLRHELQILARQTRRPRLRSADRVFLAAASRLLPRCRWSSLFVSPDTLLRWHRQRGDGPIRTVVWAALQLPARSASLFCAWPREPTLGLPANRRRGWRPRLYCLSDDRPQAHPWRRSGTGGRTRWSHVAQVHPCSSGEPDRLRFLHRRHLPLDKAVRPVFIELGSRRVHLAGCSQNPTGAWGRGSRRAT